MEIDLICGMSVDPKNATEKSVYKGKTFYFCSAGCKKAFEQDPEKYLKTGTAGHGMK